MNTQDCPTPWRVRSNGYQVEDANGGLIAQTHSDADQPGLLPHPQATEIARLIVRACNAHDALLAACQAIVDNYGHGRSIRPQVEQCAEAIAQATAESAK